MPSTKYMSMTGSDTTGAGTLLSPYKTLGKCIAMTTTGDTIYLLPGTYTATEWPMSTTVSNRIVTAVSPLTTIVNWSTNVADSFMTVTGTISISNIMFRGGVAQRIQSSFFNSNAIAVLSLNNCIFDANSLGGVQSYGNLTGFCFFSSGGIISPLTFTMNGCILKDYTTTNAGDGILMSSNNANATWTITNNVFYATSGTYAQVTETLTGLSFTFKNNIFYNGCTSTKAFGSAPTVFNNNCVYGYTSVPAGLNNITSDPLFIDAVNYNFRLRRTSPCLGTGVLV
jgi:hypothetical protein